MTLILTGINALLCVFMVYATAVQLNDPDWYSWILVYGGASYLSFMAAFFSSKLGHKYHQIMIYAVLGAAVFGFLYYMSSVKLDWGYITTDEYGGVYEEARESLGMVTVIVSVTVTYLTHWFNNKNQ